MAHRTAYHHAYERLYAVAEAQQGYFTAKQASDAGFDPRNHPYHVNAGNWVRERRAIYRLARFPPADRPDLILWSLWSMGRKNSTPGVFSHETALAIHELSDAMPAKLHLTVPTGFRRMAPTPKGLVLHLGVLNKQDVELRQGYLVTRPLRTLADLVEEGRLSPDLIQQAARQALDRGLVRLAGIEREAHLAPTTRKALEKLLKEASR